MKIKDTLTLLLLILAPLSMLGQNAWQFETGLEGWTLNKSLTGNSENGVLTLEIIDKDPNMSSPNIAGLSAASATQIVVAMKNNTPETSARIYFATETVGFSATTFIDFVVKANSEMQEYIIDMTSNAQWKGMVKKIRLDPINTPTANSGSIEIDYIKIIEDGCEAQGITYTQPTGISITDAPFVIEASTTSALPLVYSILSGPATLSSNTISLTGNPGVVKVLVSQAGNDNYCSAEKTLSFYVNDPQAQQGKPNILFVVIEDMGMQLSHLGTKGLQTPTLDKCIDEGVFFEKAYCNYPSCSPAKTSFLTGVWPHKHNTVRNVHEAIEPNPSFTQAQLDFMVPLRMSESLPTLIEELKEGGYRTGLANKFHIYPHSKFPFDEWNEHGTAATAKDFANTTPEGQPYFFMYNIKYTHRPFKTHINIHNRSSIDPSTVEVPPFLPDTQAEKIDWAEYLTTVEIVDHHLKLLLDEMKTTARYNNTLVVVVSDHGPSYHRGKFSGYNFGYHVPLIITGPLVDTPKACDELVSLTDLMPTFMAYADLPLSQPVDGQSLKPVIDGDATFKGHDFVLGEVQYTWSRTLGLAPETAHDFIIMDGQHRYIRHMNNTLKRVQPGDNVDEVPWQNFAYSGVENARINYPEPYNLLQTLLLPPGEEFFDDQVDYWSLHDKMQDNSYKPVIDKMSHQLDSIIRVDIDGINAVPQTQAESDLKVVPNPVKDCLRIENLPPNTSLGLYTMTGQQLECVQNQNTVDVSALAAGTYMLALENSNTTLVFIKK